MNCCLLTYVFISLSSLPLLLLCDTSAVSSSVTACHRGDPVPHTLNPNAKCGGKRIELHSIKMLLVDESDLGVELRAK